jgi:oligoendopeptidase F
MNDLRTFRRGLAVVVCCLLLSLPIIAAEGDIPQRGDIAEADTWNLADMYPTPAAWEEDFQRLENGLPLFQQYQGHLGESPDKLLECLRLNDSLGNILYNLYVYANLKLDEDQRVAESQERSGRIRGLYSRLNAASAFIQPEILSIPGEKVQNWLGGVPELDMYRFYLEDMLRTKEHILSEGEERILALAGQVTSSANNIFGAIDNSDMRYGKVLDQNGDSVELTKGRYALIMESRDRTLRAAAAEVYNQAYLERQNTLAATLASSFKSDWFYAQSRGYNTCLEMSLDANNIPTLVFHSLIKAANDNLAPLHKWCGLRKRILGYDTLYTHDLSAPLLDRDPAKYTWDEAKALVVEALQPLGEQYIKDLQTGLNSRWIDVYETQGKESGGYNWGSYSSHPYILLNYNGTLNEVFTLAHEMGHAMHHHYTNSNEPFIYGGHSLFTAEVASTCNEAIMMKHMIDKTTDKHEKIELLIQYIEQIIGTFYTQVMFSEFELAMHEHLENGGAFSPEFMRQKYQEIYQKYWGPELTFGQDRNLGCLRVGHFYRQYYVYQYATCYAAALALSQDILHHKPGALERYMNFLQVGTSKHPVDILRDAGVDMTTPDPVAKTVALFGELVDQIEVLLNEVEG